ncbi:DNA topology modulation protein [Caldibacillus lycopersici]|uniref:DNA topology modulation protein n=1 Tax=Perspicuibacillus lycopersici TaxID=1325689 RepID=A0AAE3IXY9_9BACI|nr:DNA topology modulation protein [Perspicuibacillus lycopersici]MCU9614984.1 DNA topology modulation protein [Perspicuibacillus lycopersici]
MKKIILIGSGGAGKSTLARRLSEKLNIEVFHLDALFWKPNWVMVPRNEQIEVQQHLVKQPEWIIDGNYNGTMDIRLQAADTIIFVDLHRLICMYRAFKRMWKYRKKTRPDMGDGCEERLDWSFLKWIWTYPKKRKPEILYKLSQLADEKNIIILSSRKEIRQFIETLGVN